MQHLAQLDMNGLRGALDASGLLRDSYNQHRTLLDPPIQPFPFGGQISSNTRAVPSSGKLVLRYGLAQQAFLTWTLSTIIFKGIEGGRQMSCLRFGAVSLYGKCPTSMFRQPSRLISPSWVRPSTNSFVFEKPSMHTGSISIVRGLCTIGKGPSRVPSFSTLPRWMTAHPLTVKTSTQWTSKFSLKRGFSSLQQTGGDKGVASWLFLCSGLVTVRIFECLYINLTTRPSEQILLVFYVFRSSQVFGMVVVGGLTRLTKSGLSMVDWKFQVRQRADQINVCLQPSM